MTVKVAQLGVDITLNGLPEVKKGLSEVEKAGKQAAVSMEAAMKLVRGYFGVQTAKAIADMAESWQMISARVALYAKNSADAAMIQSQMVSSANEARSSLESQAQLYTRIASQAQSLGATSQQILAVTKLVGQANAVSGASVSEAAASATQLAQALGSGKLAGDELKSILENSPRLAQAIADGLGVGVGQLREMGKEGKLLSTDVFAALLSQSERMSAEFAKIPPTIGGAITVMANSLTENIGRLNQQLGITRGIAEGIIALFGDDRMMLFFGENPLESRTGSRGKNRIFLANRGDVRRQAEENAAFASQSLQNPLFSGSSGIGGPGFGVGPAMFRQTLANALSGSNGIGTGPSGPTPPPAGKPNKRRSPLFVARPDGAVQRSSFGSLEALASAIDAARAERRSGIRGSGASMLSQLGNTGSLSGVVESNITSEFGAMAERISGFAQGIGGTIVDSIATGITVAVQSGSITEGLRQLGGSLIGGVGSMLMDFGKKMLVASGLMETLFRSLSSFLPGGGIGASIALIGLGAAMVGIGQRAARSSFSGAGRSDGFSGGGFSIPGAVSSSSVFGTPSSVIADGRVPLTSTPNAVSAATPMVFNIIGPNDPTAQRMIRELVKNADGRGAF